MCSVCGGSVCVGGACSVAVQTVQSTWGAYVAPFLLVVGAYVTAKINRFRNK